MTSRRSASVALGLALLMAGPAAAGALPPGPCVQASLVNDRCELWASVYDDPAAYVNGGEDYGLKVVAGDGLVYTAVASETASGWDIVVRANRADTGAVAWTRRWDFDSDYDDVWSLALVGSTVVVVGESAHDFLVLALDAENGDIRWSDLRDGGTGGYDVAYAVAASPDGSTVFAAGMRDRDPTTAGTGDAWVVAYDAATGALRWDAKYAGPGGTDFAEDVDVAPDGRRVYVTMTSPGLTTGSDLAVAAFEASDEERLGAVLWDRRLHGGAGTDDPIESELSADGQRLFTTLTTQAPPTGALFSANYDILTVAHATADGTQAWLQRVDGDHQGWDYAQGLVVAGGRVIVVGSIASRVTQSDVVVLAYDGSTGSEAWRSLSPAVPIIADMPADIAVAPNGNSVYVASTWKVPRASGGVQGVGITTNHGTIVTAAHAVADGDVVWVGRHSSAAETAIDTAAALAVAPDGGRVFVTGSYGHRPVPQGNLFDAVTLAYTA